jgi:hypothetical protein
MFLTSPSRIGDSQSVLRVGVEIGHPQSVYYRRVMYGSATIDSEREKRQKAVSPWTTTRNQPKLIETSVEVWHQSSLYFDRPKPLTRAHP